MDPTWQRRLLILLGVGALLMIVYIAKLSAFSAVDLWSNVPVLDATTAEHAAALQSIPLFLHFHKAGGSFACRLAAKSFPLTAEQQAGGCALLGDGPESLAQGHAGWANSEWTCGERSGAFLCVYPYPKYCMVMLMACVCAVPAFVAVAV